MSPKASSFTTCDVCSHDYNIKDVDGNGNVVNTADGGCAGYKPKSMIKFSALVTVDFSVILLVWQILVFTCAGFIALCDYDYGLRAQLFGPDFNVYLATYM